MNVIYKIPGYILCLLGGFFLSWGGLIVRLFENADIWQMLFLRSLFFLIALTFFLFITYKSETFQIIKKSGFAGIIGGLVLSLSFVSYVVSMTETTVANVVFIISTQTIFLAIMGYFFLKEKISLTGFVSILLAISGIGIMVGDSINQGSLFGNIVALAIPINFSILVVIIRKYPQLDMVPAIFYSGFFSLIYGFVLSNDLNFSNHDMLMGFLLGVPQLAFGFICITIGSRTTPAVTVGLLMLLESLCGTLWVWIFLGEIPPLSVLIGGGVIIAAIVVKYFDKKQKDTVNSI
jgi:DME family drug/metabolite transporter